MSRCLIFGFVTMFVLLMLGIQPITAAENETAKGFPEFTLENLDGKDIKSADAFGDADLILIDFFTYYCKPCKKLMPYVDEFQKEYGDHGFKAILFDEDEPEGIPLTRSYMKQKDYSFEVLFDIEGRVETFYSVTKQPTTIFLDASGNIVHRHEGYNKGDEKALEDFIRTFLEEKGKLEKSD
jgi:thiol-disulfide isomerase/thioredoxin